jgi:hypothetical protein
MKVLSRENLSKDKKKWGFKPGFDIREHIQKSQVPGSDEFVLEFLRTGDFDTVWYDRQRYEVFAGRDFEPVLYEPFYDVTVDPTLPRNVTVNKIGPAGVVFNEVKEGGEVRFASVSQTSYTVPIKHYAFGLEYDKDLLMYNELWNVAIVERQAGIAYNALLNHVHLFPIIDFTYTSANQTAASSVGSSLTEKYLRTIEDAITNSRTDTTNPRRGPYALLMSTANLFTMERALNPVPQEGFSVQSSAMNQIQTIVAYDGWSGTRGKKVESYTGVTANKAYLIDINPASKMNYARSFFKQTLESQLGESDMSRFIMNQVIWDVYFGLYVSVAAIAEEITLPTS